MFSDLFYQLWDKGEFLRAIWETVYMTLLSTLVAYGIGLPLGIVLNVTSKGGLHPQRGLNAALGFLVNIFRSIPFIILMVAMLPVAKAIVGTSLGNKAMVVMLIIAAAPYVARMVESALQEVKPGVKRTLMSGIELEDGPIKVDSFRIVDTYGDITTVEIVVHEGRNRLVRRMMEAVGYPVRELVRTGFGPITLDHLKQGTTRRVKGNALTALYGAVGL